MFARLHDASGAPLGASEFRVNAWTTGRQQAPQVAGTAGGLFVVVWESQGQDGSGTGIFARRFDAAGSALGAEFQVNTYATADQADAAVALDAAGNFVVVWQSAGADGNNFGIRARRFDAAGQAQGEEFQVNSYTTAAQRRPAVASDATGNFVLAWQSVQDPDNSAGVYAQRYDALGAPVGGEYRVNTFTTNGQGSPVVGSDAAGNFVVVWISFGQDGSGGYGLFGQRYDAAGSPLGGEFGLNTFTTGNQFIQSLALEPGGRFAVVWVSPGDGSGDGVFGRLFDAAGVPDGPDFQFNTYTAGDQTVPAVAVDGNGRFVVAWSSLNQDASGDGVFAQRFGRDLIFHDSFEDSTLGAWSASATDGGDLSVSVCAGLKFTAAGLRGEVNDTAGLYVQDDRPPTRAVTARASTSTRTASIPARRRTTSGHAVHRLRGGPGAPRSPRSSCGAWAASTASARRVRRDDNTQAETPFIPITDGPHFVESTWAADRTGRRGRVLRVGDRRRLERLPRHRQQPQRRGLRAPGRPERQGRRQRHAVLGRVRVAPAGRNRTLAVRRRRR